MFKKAKKTKRAQAVLEELEKKVAVALARSKTRLAALHALEALNPAMGKVTKSRMLLLRVLGEDGLTEKQREKLLEEARWELGDVDGLLRRV